MKQRFLLILDILLDCLGYILITYLLESAAVSFRASYLSVLFRSADLVILGICLDRLKQKTERKNLPYLILFLCVLVEIALMYHVGYLKMTLARFS